MNCRYPRQMVRLYFVFCNATPSAIPSVCTTERFKCQVWFSKGFHFQVCKHLMNCSHPPPFFDRIRNFNFYVRVRQCVINTKSKQISKFHIRFLFSSKRQQVQLVLFCWCVNIKVWKEKVFSRLFDFFSFILIIFCRIFSRGTLTP